MDKSWWVATGIAVFSLGLTAFLVKKMKPEVENYIVRVGVVLMFMGLAIFVGGIFVPPSKQEEQNLSPIIQQNNPVYSPPIVGDKNTVTINPAPQPWEITTEQKEKLRTALNKVPSGETYKLAFHVIPGCSRCNVYADNIIGAMHGLQGWEVQGDTYVGLNPSLTGVLVGSDPETPCPSTAVQLIRGALEVADIPYSSFPLKGKDKDLAPAPGFCVVLVGDKPRG